MKSASESTIVPVPDGLSPRAAALWRELQPTKARSRGRQEMLAQALLALDVAETARAAFAGGLTVTSGRSGVTHVKPEARLWKDAMNVFTTSWRALGLTWDARVDGVSR